jgi:hypothetical protein
MAERKQLRGECEEVVDAEFREKFPISLSLAVGLFKFFGDGSYIRQKAIRAYIEGMNTR